MQKIPKSIPELIKQLEKKDRQQAVDELIRRGAPAINALIQLFETGEESLKILSIDILSEMNAKKAIPTLIYALANPKIKNYAVQALMELKPATRSEVLPLIKALTHQNSSVRITAALFLGETGSKAPIPYLITALGDENEVVRQSATTALVNIGAASAPLLTIFRAEAIR